ncbi:uncharacterized protein B0I36DRAFT_351556 [Microdochium trichocladiopsis]|uniref:Uncharacterized protein n=1 Tax=Microdochium trichocladiopsis TaxID=1682393 RepID=A0A9P9BP38_9PEZI|nr:uncharacterized protein B0I36DRAFT_351556 [Microdochium trichocladiopsis]KAH7028134.1 hypothetical protein B0I36DRAFT_351556 [Microdochium trichocladiopsis]
MAAELSQPLSHMSGNRLAAKCISTALVLCLSPLSEQNQQATSLKVRVSFADLSFLLWGLIGVWLYHSKSWCGGVGPVLWACLFDVSRVTPHMFVNFLCPTTTTTTTMTLIHINCWQVLIVQSPLGDSFKSISNALAWPSRALGDIQSHIDWDLSDTQTLPPITAELRFVRHYALCLVPKGVWNRDDLTRLEKIQQAWVWEHTGKKAELRDPTRLAREVIQKIDAVQDIGETQLNPDAEVIVYQRLFCAWGPYHPLFWNCHDLAIRLAYVILGESAGELLRELLGSLKRVVGSVLQEATSISLGALHLISAATMGNAYRLVIRQYELANAVHIALYALYKKASGAPTDEADEDSARGQAEPPCRRSIHLEQVFPELGRLHEVLATCGYGASM